MEHKTIKGIGGEVHYWISRTSDKPKGEGKRFLNGNELSSFRYYSATVILAKTDRRGYLCLVLKPSVEAVAEP